MTPSHESSPPDPVRLAPSISRRSLLAAVAIGAIGAGTLQTAPAVALATLPYKHPFTEQWFVPNEGEWGNRASWRSYPPHAGVDYNIVGGSAGKTIRAIADGYIRGKGVHPNYGNRVYIEHDDGMWSHYAHMQSPSSKSNGDRVTLGTPIGNVGNTGLSYGAHLHLEMATTAGRCHDGTTSINPIAWIDGHSHPSPSGPAPAASGPTAVIDTADRISLYSIRTDGNLWGASQASAGAGLSPWVKLGGDLGTLSGRPAAVWLANGTLAIYARTALGTIVGTNQASVGGSFTRWTTIGAGGNGIIGDPVAVQFDSGAIGIYAATDSGSIAGVAQASAGAGFGAWTTIGTSNARLLGKPALVKYSDGRIALFARTESTHVFGTSQTSVGSTFAAWSDLGTGGAGISTDPAVINDSDRITVFAGAGSTVSSVSHDIPNGAFGAWVNLGSGPVSVGSATPSVLQTGSTYSIYSLGGDGTVWGSTVNAVPAAAGWGQIGSGATLMTALTSVRTSAGLNAVYGTSSAGAVVGSGQSTPGSAFGPWSTM
ncbi:peptidoglycan DD-metalloendopeptidase family protein [uncultured Microbacterium sp.]|uniref:peptidoglycan DD-metalloendopeptidase family protein n=1 Tax=uncultured Microbacterium sp. TaxID=191216 RepID=UPI0028D06374|nr:peptidoglycan DD-metalloendopeptidase family protein [uncultured Microbacterium sp.]